MRTHFVEFETQVKNKCYPPLSPLIAQSAQLSGKANYSSSNGKQWQANNKPKTLYEMVINNDLCSTQYIYNKTRTERKCLFI